MVGLSWNHHLFSTGLAPVFLSSVCPLRMLPGRVGAEGPAQLPVVGGREGTQTLLSPQPPLLPFLIYLGSRKAWGRKPTLSCPSPSQAIISPEMN